MRANCRLLKVRDLRCVPIVPGTIRGCLKLPEPARKRPKVPERSVTSWRSGQMPDPCALQVEPSEGLQLA
eukprot:7895529-Alexandrium_andersonii.AAC.1